MVSRRSTTLCSAGEQRHPVTRRSRRRDCLFGPQGGGAYHSAKGWIEATTGLVAGEDHEVIKTNWQTGLQAFLDGKVDMYVTGRIDPCPQFVQFTEAETLRRIRPDSHDGEAVDRFLGNFRNEVEIPVDLYRNQVNDALVM